MLSSNPYLNLLLLPCIHYGYYTHEASLSGYFSSSYFSFILQPILSGSLVDVVINLLLIAAIIYFLYAYLFTPAKAYLDHLLNFRGLADKDFVYLQITPPDYVDKSAIASEELISILRATLDKEAIMSLEIVATKDQGIRFLIRTLRDNAPIIQKHLVAHIPNAKFKVLKEASTAKNIHGESYSQLFELRQSRHYSFPLKKHRDYSEHDPIAFLTGSMTKLATNEGIAIQLVISPHNSWWTSRLYNKLLSNGHAPLDSPLKVLLRNTWWLWIVGLFYGSLTHSFTSGLDLVVLGTVIYLFIPKKEVKLTKAKQRIYDEALEKLAEPLIRADMRVQVSADTSKKVDELVKALGSSLSSFSVDGYQGFSARKSAIDAEVKRKFLQYKFNYRLPSLFGFNSCVLSITELASIYHLPYGDITTEDMVLSHSRSLPVPLVIKNGKFDVILGESDYQDSGLPIGLTVTERERHVYVVGSTGSGKTTMLQYAMVQDIKNGKGIALVDPHGDLADSLLKYIPPERFADVIYFNPRNIGHPIGLNLLELPAGLSGDDLLIEQDFITESVVSIFRKIFSDDDSGGHRIEHFLRNAIHTAFTVENATLFTVYKLLTNAKFRKSVVDKLDDEGLIDFWKGEFNSAGDYQKVKMSSGVNAKLGRFQRSAVTRRILEQPHSTIDFDDIIQNNKILICNFSKGQIGEDTSTLLGISILTKLQLAALRRSRLEQAKRSPFYLYVDEFQNFATTSFVQLLSEARKYKLFLTMAEQSTAQQEEQRLVDIILANVGTVVCFRSGSPADERLLLPLFAPHIAEGEIASLEAHHFYAKFGAITSQKPLSGQTVLLKDEGSNDIANNVKIESLKRYSSRYVAGETNQTISANKPKNVGEEANISQKSQGYPEDT